jgi:hypothetical protein
LEKLKIVHCNIKMENFAVKKNDLGFIVQLADLSESKLLENLNG